MGFNIMSLVRSKPTYRLTKLEFLVLLALRKKPLHGYAIMKKLENKLPGVWSVKSGSLYPLLKRMVRKELLKTRNSSGRLTYCLTDEGREAVDQYVRAWKELYVIFKEMNKK